MSKSNNENKFTAQTFIKKISSFFSSSNQDNISKENNTNIPKINIYEQIRKEEIKNIIKDSDQELKNKIKEANFNNINKIPYPSVEIKSLQHLKKDITNLNKNDISEANYIKIKADTFINKVQDKSETKTNKKNSSKKVSDIELFEKLKGNIIEIINSGRSTGSIKSHRILYRHMSEEDISLIEKFKEKALKLQVEQSKAKDSLSPVSKFKIYTERLLMGIIIENTRKSVIVGGNNKKDFINFMKDYSIANHDIDTLQSTLNYEDVSIKAEFNDKSILKSIEFTDKFVGSTIKDLKIGDVIEKAINLYGEPKKKNHNTLIWDTFELSYILNKITRIKIGS